MSKILPQLSSDYPPFSTHLSAFSLAMNFQFSVSIQFSVSVECACKQFDKHQFVAFVFIRF